MNHDAHDDDRAQRKDLAEANHRRLSVNYRTTSSTSQGNALFLLNAYLRWQQQAPFQSC